MTSTPLNPILNNCNGASSPIDIPVVLHEEKECEYCCLPDDECDCEEDSEIYDTDTSEEREVENEEEIITYYDENYCETPIRVKRYIYLVPDEDAL